MTRLVIFLLMVACVDQLCHAGQRYALVVGVEDYLPEFFRNLDYAQEDAVEVSKQLSELGYHVISLTASEKSPARKPSDVKTILRALDGRLKGLQQDDVLLVMMTGHGVQFADEPNLPDGSRESYFCPEQARLDDKSTLLPISKELLPRIKACPAARKLVLLDACRNAVLSPAGDKSVKKIKLGSIHENLRTVPRGMSVLFSCSSGEKSWEHKSLGHSVFSNYVLTYLRGKAATDLYDRGRPDIDGLVTYVRRQTNNFVVDNIAANGQRPELVGDRESWHIGQTSTERQLLKLVLDQLDAYLEAPEAAIDYTVRAARILAPVMLVSEPVDEAALNELFARMDEDAKGGDTPVEAKQRIRCCRYLLDSTVLGGIRLSDVARDTLDFHFPGDLASLEERTTPSSRAVATARIRSELYLACLRFVDHELRRSAVDLLLRPLETGAFDSEEIDKATLISIVQGPVELLESEFRDQHFKQFFELKARVESVARLNADAFELVGEKLLMYTKCMPGRHALQMLGDLEIEEGLDAGWGSLLKEPTILVYSFCDCPTETAVLTKLVKARESLPNRNTRIVGACSIKGQLATNIAENDYEHVRFIKIGERPAWVQVAPLIMFFDDDGRIVTTVVGGDVSLFSKRVREWAEAE